MDRGFVSGIVDRLSDMIEGGVVMSVEENKLRETLENWRRIEGLLNDLSSRSHFERIGLMCSTTLPAILSDVKNSGREVSRILDERDEWEIGRIMEKAKPDQVIVSNRFVEKKVSCYQRPNDDDGDDRVSRTRKMIGELGRCFRPNNDDNDDDSRVSRTRKMISELEIALGTDVWEARFSYAKAAFIVVGRDEELKSLQQRLKWGENRVKVITIVGERSTGKSALARKLFYQPVGPDAPFDRITWAWMSSGSFNVRQIPLGMFDDVGDKRLLLIIDGLEKVECTEWMSFVYSILGHRVMILVTTTSEEVVNEIRSDHTHRLLPLSPMGCYQILKAVLKITPEVPFSNSKEKILWNIAEKCQGLPVFAWEYGMKLRRLKTKEWKKTSEDIDISWVARFNSVWFIRPLIRDYNQLSPQLKRCIAFCARFPNQAVINVDQLVGLWMAKGYLHPPASPLHRDDDKSREKRGLEYFNDLAGKSFFPELVKSSVHTNKVTGCRMNGRFSQFARYMAPRETAFTQNTIREVHETCLTFSHSKSIPLSVFGGWKYVKGMVLSFCHLEQLPPGVENMTLLQYLDLSGNPLKELPKKICKWYSLQSLDVSLCYLLSHLPKWIGELQRLQHLRVNHTTDELHNLPKEFEKLTLIRTMDFFSIGGDKYKTNVEKLRHLNGLEEVCLAVHGEVDFLCADLGSKTSMENLELCFMGEGRDQEMASSMMREFTPPPNLEMLKLKGYPGFRLPRWIQAKSLVDKLKRLSLRSASNLSSLSALWKLSSLEFLWLYGIPNIKHLGLDFFGLPKTLGQDVDDEENISDYSDNDVVVVIPPTGERAKETFRCLKTLRIEYLKNWKRWEDVDEAYEKRFQVMPCLQELIIADCPVLEAMPQRVLGKISSVKITGCDKLVRG